MKSCFRALVSPLLTGLLLLISLTPFVSAAHAGAARAVHLPISSFSGGVLMAQAIHSGRVHVPRPAASSNINPNLTCSPAPCVLPNVQASGNGGGVVNETPITANPNNPQHLLSGGNDYNCGSIQGFYASSDGGTTWNHTCLDNLPGSSGCGDPGVGYDLRGTAYISGVDCGSTPWYVAFEK